MLRSDNQSSLDVASLIFPGNRKSLAFSLWMDRDREENRRKGSDNFATSPPSADLVWAKEKDRQKEDQDEDWIGGAWKWMPLHWVVCGGMSCLPLLTGSWIEVQTPITKLNSLDQVFPLTATVTDLLSRLEFFCLFSPGCDNGIESATARNTWRRRVFLGLFFGKSSLSNLTFWGREKVAATERSKTTKLFPFIAGVITPFSSTSVTGWKKRGKASSALATGRWNLGGIYGQRWWKVNVLLL